MDLIIVIFLQAIIIMLEDAHERVMTLMKNLLQFFSKTNIVKPDQIKNVSAIFFNGKCWGR